MHNPKAVFPPVTMVTPQLRREVLRVYRQIFQVARSWQAAEESENAGERAYIREEARRLFRKNKNVRVGTNYTVAL